MHVDLYHSHKLTVKKCTAIENCLFLKVIFGAIKVNVNEIISIQGNEQLLVCYCF